MPDELAAMQYLAENNLKMVHYTSAEVFLNIVKNKEIWLRNAILMNDFSEIDYGLECLNRVLGKDGSFCKAISLYHRDFFDDLISRLKSWIPTFRNETYVTCLSEHLPGEWQNGRLSMWRAYAPKNGVAAVINTHPFTYQGESAFYSSPVNYKSFDDFEIMYNKISDEIKNNLGKLLIFPYDEMMDRVFHSLRNAALCTKHPGFSEEREWRVLYSPTHERSDLIMENIECINGVPQIVYKIPLIDNGDEGLFKADLNNLLDYVIIGPTEEPSMIFHALVKALRDNGVEDAIKKVRISGIPLRT